MKKKIEKSGFHYLKDGNLLDSMLQNGSLNKDQALIASYNNQSRFLLNDGTLIIAPNKTVAELHEAIFGKNMSSFNNFLYFHLGDGLGHAHILLSCAQCDDGKPHHKFYDFIGKIYTNDMIMGFHGCEGNLSCHEERMKKQSIKFFLDDDQAKSVLSAVSNLISLNEQGKYKFVSLIHNCISLFTDIYKDAGFSHHYSQYLTDGELLDTSKAIDGFLGGHALLHRFYYPYPDNYLNPSRSQVQDFVVSIFGPDFAKNWDDIEDKYVDLEAAKHHLPVLNEIDQVQAYRRISLDVLDKIYFYTNCPDKISPSAFQLLKAKGGLLANTEQSVTYLELYYAYIVKHVVEILEIFKDTEYFSSIALLTDNDQICGGDENILGICHINDFEYLLPQICYA